MNKSIEQISHVRIKRISIVLGNGRLARQVRADEGCNLTFNLGFYEG